MARPKRTLAARVGLGFLLAFLLALPSGYAFLEWTVQPSFCTNCHLMQPYYDSWAKSSHNHVACIECHYEPGVIETLHGKVTALNMVVKYFTGEAGTKPFAEVSDNSCMRGGCHSTRLLAGTVKFDVGGTTIDFDHGPHLLEMRGGKQLRCTSCHSQIVQGEHINVTPSTCFLCHFKDAAAAPKTADCRTCHDAPAAALDLGGGVSFDHGAYVARGVDCATCHRDTVEGRGEVPRSRCLSCHGDASSLEKYGETELLHRRHVTDKKVDCLECHLEITHGLADKGAPPPAAAPAAGAAGHPAPAGEGCAACHASSHGPAESVYRGTGGRGAPDLPSAMALARVDCAACHRTFPGEDPLRRPVSTAREVACLACHGAAAEGILPGWQASIGAAMEAAEAEVRSALAAAEGAGRGDLAIRLRDAAHDVALLRADGSRGAHNPGYARALLEAARRVVLDAWKGIDPDRPAPAPLFPALEQANGTCATLCHMGVEKRVHRLGGTRFEHAAHASAGIACASCHSDGPRGAAGSVHGKVLPAARDCLSCHHGAKAPSPAAKRDCASCHADAAAFLKGEWEGIEPAAMMAEVTCDACHGDPPVSPVRAPVKESCAQCHDDPSYPGMVDDWAADAAAWLSEAEGRLAKAREAAAARGTAAAEEPLARAAAILERVRRSGPQHNILLFEEVKNLFDDAMKYWKY